MAHLRTIGLALLLLLVALPARAQELSAATAFEVSGDHVRWGSTGPASA